LSASKILAAHAIEFLPVSGLCAVELFFLEIVTMFDAQIAVALFAAFLLGMVAGSGMEIIVRGGRH
jgi:hypothetical protein